MKKISKKIRENIKVLIAFILGLIISGGAVSAATILFNSNAVNYDNTDSGLESDNVQDAIDELYNKSQYAAFFVDMNGSNVLFFVTPNLGMTPNQYPSNVYMKMSSICVYIDNEEICNTKLSDASSGDNFLNILENKGFTCTEQTSGIGKGSISCSNNNIVCQKKIQYNSYNGFWCHDGNYRYQFQAGMLQAGLQS